MRFAPANRFRMPILWWSDLARNINNGTPLSMPVTRPRWASPNHHAWGRPSTCAKRGGCGRVGGGGNPDEIVRFLTYVLNGIRLIWAEQRGE